MFAMKNWYGAAWSDEISTAPLGRRICDKPIVLFRDSKGAVCALDATCPHRGADLARGRLRGDAIECPFHGMRFDGNGRCVLQPAEGDECQSHSDVGVDKYSVKEVQGIVWIWMDPTTDPSCDAPHLEMLERPDVGFARIKQAELIPASYVNAVDNALDNCHLAFVHTGTLPNANPKTDRYKVVPTADRRGFEATRIEEFGDSESVRQAAWPLRQMIKLKRRIHGSPLGSSEETAEQGYSVEGIVWFRRISGDGTMTGIIALNTPCDANNTWMMAGVVKTGSISRLSSYLTRRWLKHLVAEDKKAMELFVREASGPSGLVDPYVLHADNVSFPWRGLYASAMKREGRVASWQKEAAQ